MARAAAVLDDVSGGAAERGRCGDIFSSVIDPRASFVACAAISGEVGVLSNVARCSCATTRVATQLLLDDVIVGCTAGTQHANTCTRACAPRLVAARATSMVRTLTLGGLSAHLAGAKRLDVGAGRGSRLLHGSATAAGRREVTTRRAIDAAAGPTIGASRPAAGSRARAAAFDVSRTSACSTPAWGPLLGFQSGPVAKLQATTAGFWRPAPHYRRGVESHAASDMMRPRRGGSAVRCACPRWPRASATSGTCRQLGKNLASGPRVRRAGCHEVPCRGGTPRAASQLLTGPQRGPGA